MSEERNKAEDVERLKEELNEWIDHRIVDNNAFISSPKKETLSLLFALLPLLAICGSWLWGILKQYYIYSLHLVFILWTVVGITESIAKRKGTKEFIKAHINLKDAVYFSFRNVKAMVFSFDVLLTPSTNHSQKIIISLSNLSKHHFLPPPLKTTIFNCV